MPSAPAPKKRRYVKRMTWASLPVLARIGASNPPSSDITAMRCELRPMAIAAITAVERVILAASPDRNKQCGFAERRDAFGKIFVPACEQPLAPRQHARTQQNADRYTTGGSDPLVVESILHAQRNRDEERHDADQIEPSASNQVFDVDGS